MSKMNVAYTQNQYFSYIDVLKMYETKVERRILLCTPSDRKVVVDIRTFPFDAFDLLCCLCEMFRISFHVERFLVFCYVSKLCTVTSRKKNVWKLKGKIIIIIMERNASDKSSDSKQGWNKDIIFTQDISTILHAKSLQFQYYIYI